ncbi:hypothetical protein [Sorangium sp. So ce1024]|uniref:hypothetical protein n=1 Tax=Sorangium sp. So ce1024 TaxID=3133327 RepID=UPI003EFECB3F
MTTISFDLPDDAVLAAMHVPPSEVTRELRMAAAVKLFELAVSPRAQRPAWRGCPAPRSSRSWRITASTPSA